MPKGIPKSGINKGWFSTGHKPSVHFKKGQSPWNKGLFKESDIRVLHQGRSISKSKKGVAIWGGARGSTPWMEGDKNPQWKGEFVSYSALHHWLNRVKGKATECIKCGKTGGKKGCHWANVPGQYTRNPNDYIPLCPYCHRQFDLGRINIQDILS